MTGEAGNIKESSNRQQTKAPPQFYPAGPG